MWILLGQGNNYFSIFVSIRADDREEQRERGSPLGEPTPSASWERDREKWSISHSRHLHNKDQTPWGGKSQPTGTCQWLREDETHPQPTTCVLCHCTKAISPGSDSLDHNLKFMLLLLSINKLLAKKGMDCESLRSWHWGVRSSPRRSVLNSKRERTEDTWHLHLGVESDSGCGPPFLQNQCSPIYWGRGTTQIEFSVCESDCYNRLKCTLKPWWCCGLNTRATKRDIPHYPFKWPLLWYVQ